MQVKVGAITHLGKFLGHLNLPCRERYLPILRELHTSVAATDWRRRQLLASQYVVLGEQYPAQTINSVLAPLVLELLQDSVCVVRETAHTAIAVLLRHLKKEADQQWVSSLFSSLVALASEQSYQERQVLCSRERGLAQVHPTALRSACLTLKCISFPADFLATVRCTVYAD